MRADEIDEAGRRKDRKGDVTHLAELAGTGVVTAQAVYLIAECGTVAATRNGRLGHEDAAAQGGNNNIAGSIARGAGSGDGTELERRG
jgi:hypothetical protein